MNSQSVLKIQRGRPTSFILMIAGNAILTELVSTQTGSFLRSVCANCEVTSRPPFAFAFQSETMV
jgi:hypothetical protein